MIRTPEQRSFGNPDFVVKQNVLGLFGYKPQEIKTSSQEALGILEDWVSASVGLNAPQSRGELSSS